MGFFDDLKSKVSGAIDEISGTIDQKQAARKRTSDGGQTASKTGIVSLKSAGLDDIPSWVHFPSPSSFPPRFTCVSCEGPRWSRCAWRVQVWKTTNAKTMDVSNNSLGRIPGPKLAQLCALQKLNLSECQLKELPAEVSCFKTEYPCSKCIHLHNIPCTHLNHYCLKLKCRLKCQLTEQCTRACIIAL